MAPNTFNPDDGLACRCGMQAAIRLHHGDVKNICDYHDDINRVEIRLKTRRITP